MSHNACSNHSDQSVIHVLVLLVSDTSSVLSSFTKPMLKRGYFITPIPKPILEKMIQSPVILPGL